MSDPVINWDTPFGAIKLSTLGSGASGRASVPQEAVDLFGEDNVRAAYVSKRMRGGRDGCGAVFSLDHVLHSDTLVEVIDSELIHTMKLTRDGTVGWLALHLLQKYIPLDDPNLNSNPVLVEHITVMDESVKVHLRHNSNCKIAGVMMHYTASVSQPLQTIPSWFPKI